MVFKSFLHLKRLRYQEGEGTCYLNIKRAGVLVRTVIVS